MEIRLDAAFMSVGRGVMRIGARDERRRFSFTEWNPYEQERHPRHFRFLS
jgi:hypothetical protein